MGEYEVSALDVTEFTKRVTELVYAHIPCRSMIEDADPCDPTDTFTLLRPAASGHAAAPPSRVMNSRRLMLPLVRGLDPTTSLQKRFVARLLTGSPMPLS